MAHESAFGMRDIVTLAEMGAVRTFGINPERPGGMTAALKAIDYAAAKGLDVVLHNQPSGIGSAVILHMHAARARNIRHATELQGHIMMEDDLIKDEIVYEDGFAHLPEGPGWGVELDEDAIDKYQIQNPIVIEAGCSAWAGSEQEASLPAPPVYPRLEGATCEACGQAQ